VSGKDSLRQLAQAVKGVFLSRERAEIFLRLLEQTGTKVRDFERALSELPGPGRAYRSGEQLPTTNYELYSALDEGEKVELKQIYLGCVERLEREYPDLRKDYFTVFDR
jgi:hypothetical protein